MSRSDQSEREENASTVLHWYDFICPFCYVGQQRNAILRRHGLRVVEMPLQAHPDIPPGGIPVGPRQGAMYAMLEREAKDAGLPLRWPLRLPNSGLALAAAEWARQHQPSSFPRFHKSLFAAHFALGEDLEDALVIDCHASEADIDIACLHAAFSDGSASAAVNESEAIGQRHGVEGTPAWLLQGRLITGLRSASDFERLAKVAEQLER